MRCKTNIGDSQSQAPAPKCLSWRKTTKSLLEYTDRTLLDAIPCVKERQFVSAGEERLWSVSCNPEQQGTPMLMLHGMGGGVGLWAMNLDQLARDRPVYAFDLLGFGRSSRPTFGKTAEAAEEQFVESIESYRKEMKLDQFILLGHSLGGFLSAAYCLRYPQHVKHLVLVDPWGMVERTPSPMSLRFKLLLPIINRLNPMFLLRAVGPLGPKAVKKYRPELAAIFTEKVGNPNLLHEYIYHCNAQNPSGEVGFKHMSSQVGWAKNPILQRMMDRLDPDLSVTFIYGADTWMNKDCGFEFKEAHQGPVDVEILEGAGHHVYADQYDIFNTLVQSIASSVDKR